MARKKYSFTFESFIIKDGQWWTQKKYRSGGKSTHSGISCINLQNLKIFPSICTNTIGIRKFEWGPMPPLATLGSACEDGSKIGSGKISDWVTLHSKNNIPLCITLSVTKGDTIVLPTKYGV
jgi:hypothetical protein